jgi:hypothetical protein
MQWRQAPAFSGCGPGGSEHRGPGSGDPAQFSGTGTKKRVDRSYRRSTSDFRRAKLLNLLGAYATSAEPGTDNQAVPDECESPRVQSIAKTSTCGSTIPPL